MPAGRAVGREREKRASERESEGKVRERERESEGLSLPRGVCGARARRAPRARAARTRPGERGPAKGGRGDGPSEQPGREKRPGKKKEGSDWAERRPEKERGEGSRPSGKPARLFLRIGLEGLGFGFEFRFRDFLRD